MKDNYHKNELKMGSKIYSSVVHKLYILLNSYLKRRKKKISTLVIFTNMTKFLTFTELQHR